MGTNYYLTSEPCPHCGRSEHYIHIGKSSRGWCFSLRVSEREGLTSIWDWEDKFKQPDMSILDEYGNLIAVERMLSIIKDRKPYAVGSAGDIHDSGGYYAPGLARHKIDGTHCVGHGEGPWDYIIGEFS